MISWFHELSDTLKQWIDALSLGVVAASVMKALPEATAVLSFVWICFRIYELQTVQNWLARRRAAKLRDKR